MFPYEIVDVEENLSKEIKKDFKGVERDGVVQVGPKKWFYPKTYVKQAEGLYNFPVRSDDVWLVSFPRSGTTLTQEIIWLLNNNLDFETASQVAIFERFPFYELSILHSERLIEEYNQKNKGDPIALEKIKKISSPIYEVEIPSPRHIQTHLPFSLIPPDVGVKCKAIYVARHPKDSAASYYHLCRLSTLRDYQGDFKTFWNYYTQGLVVFGPYWEHIKEGWEEKDKKNVLFLFYEDFIRDPKNYIRRIADHLEKPINEENLDKLCKHIQFENFRKKVKVPETYIKGMANDGEDFIRRGKIGGNEEFDKELNAAANKWFKDNLQKTNVVFPVDV